VIQDRCPDPNARRSQTANSNNSGSASSEATAPARQDLYNPLGADVTIPDVIGRIIRAITGVIGSIALLAFVYGGIRWMTAYTDAGVEVARNTLKNAFIGLLLIFFAYTLSSLLLSLFSGQ
jgi:amino acid transporter